MNNIGRRLYGYCNGYCGSSYTDKRIEAEGWDWILVRDEQNKVHVAQFDDGEQKQRLVNEWASEDSKCC